MMKRGENREVKIQVCPRCRSRQIQRLGSLEGDMMGAIGLLPPRFQCLDCGWIGTLVVKEIVLLQKNDVEKGNK